ncbi:MAG: GNAT family N-acetyltransferase [Clostridia bacterium]|nr:GNAT family N-acetyltransferase [Clostridia bacterium]
MKFVNPYDYKNECIAIWNSYVESGEVVFKPLDEKGFDSLFLRKDINNVSAAYADENGLAGFGFANYADGAIVAYITYIGVRKDARGKGVAEKVLQSLEEQLKKENPALEKIELVFYNPSQLAWFIPNAAPHDHPGAPGVDMASDAYRFFAKAGYVDYAIQNAYYLPLSNYVYPNAIAEGIERLKANDIEIGYYDNEKHYGFPEFFDNIKNEGWRKQVLARLDQRIVVATHKGKVVGYTGPLTISEGGRGMFCGIGVHTEYRQHGIGKILFANMCKSHSETGATFMSLFTGTTNPARKIYEGAGFSIVRSFADMRKVLN